MGYINIVSKVCKFCNKDYSTPKYKEFTSNYCSHKCSVLGTAKLRKRPLIERLKEKMGDVDENGCINWLGNQDNKGYGVIGTHKVNGSSRKSHAYRVAYELLKGEIPEDHEVCHSCDNRLCVNPDHLWTGTHKDNMRDMIQKKRDRFGGRSRK